MSERFSYLCREPFGKAARQAVHVCTHARRDAAVREPQTHGQSVFMPKTKSLSSAGYVAAFTQPWGSTLQRNARLGLMHGSPLRRDSPSMNDSNPRAAVLGEKRMSALQTDAYRRVPRQLRCQSKPSPAATDPPRGWPALRSRVFQYGTGLPQLARCWHSTHLGYLFQNAVHSLNKAAGRHFCPSYTTGIFEAYFTNLPVRRRQS